MQDCDENEWDGDVGPSRKELGLSKPRREAESDGIEPSDYTQHMLLSYLTSNHQMWIKCSPVLKDEYFDEEFRPVLNYVRGFELENHQLPSRVLIRSKTGVKLDLPEDKDSPKMVKVISQEAEEFCRNQAAFQLLLESSEVLSHDRSRGTLTNLVAEMRRVAEISVQQDLGFEIHRDIGKLLEQAKIMDGQPTGYTHLDKALNGGVTNPSFNLISAASGQGKSIGLQNLAVNYARQGHNVVYISLELPEFMIAKRFAAIMTLTRIDAVFTNLDNIRVRMHRDAKTEGKVQIKRMKITGTTLADIRSYVSELSSATGEEWSHIMIDYMDLMSPMKQGIRADNIHLKDKAISEEIYEWCHEEGSNKIVWSASQQTKGAKDEAQARQGAVAGGTGKVNTCDNLVIIKRSAEDIRDEQCWWMIEKGRNGGQGIRVPMRWNGGTQRMSDHDDEFFEEANAAPSEGEKKPTKLSKDPIAQSRTRVQTTPKPNSEQSVVTPEIAAKTTDMLEKIRAKTLR